MLSDSTPGLATDEGFVLPLKRSFMLKLWATSPRKHRTVFEEQRLGDQPRLERMAKELALPQQRSIIAEERYLRHSRRESRQRIAPVGIEPRSASARHGRQIRRPREKPVYGVREPRCALIARIGVEPCAECHGREPFRLDERVEERFALELHGRVGKIEREQRRAARLREQQLRMLDAPRLEPR